MAQKSYTFGCSGKGSYDLFTNDRTDKVGSPEARRAELGDPVTIVGFTRPACSCPPSERGNHHSVTELAKIRVTGPGDLQIAGLGA